MKTDDLIATLAADAPGQQTGLRRAFLAAAGGGALIACVAFLATLGPRPDFMQALHTMRFDFKFVVTLALAASAFLVARDMSRPEVHRSRMRKLLLTAPVLLVVAVALELYSVPQSQWMPRLIGHNMRFCTTMVPLFALGPLALLLWAFRNGAPENPARAGAVAGLIAGGIGAAFYAAHCVDDSPLFVATWYTLAIGFVTGLGALLGSRFLRW
ncbi:MAG TPA: NrsF family protein [Rhizomicrobium sp.]|nr:NrsF family protein [Rhizomicrobium sp.]